MTFAAICATLVYEPFNLSLDKIEQLDPRQLSRVYWHPRDQEGRLVDTRIEHDLTDDEVETLRRMAGQEDAWGPDK